jgi:hypothetical protein
MNEQLEQMEDKLSKLEVVTNTPDDLKIARLMQNNCEIEIKLPIIAGSILPPSILVAHVEQEIMKWEAARNNKTKLQTYTTILAPITHGIAPSLSSCLHPITIKEAIMRVNTIHTNRVLFVKTIRYIHIYVHTHICILIFICEYVYMHSYVYLHTCMDTYILIYLHTYIHTCFNELGNLIELLELPYSLKMKTMI